MNYDGCPSLSSRQATRTAILGASWPLPGDAPIFFPQRRQSLQCGLDRNVARQAGVGRQWRLRRVALIERCEVGRIAGLKSLLEALDHEVALLKRIDSIVGAHHAQQIEAPASRLRTLDAVLRLTLGGENSPTVNAQTLARAGEPEFHHVPVQA